MITIEDLTKEELIKEISKVIDLDRALLMYDNDIVEYIENIDNNLDLFLFKCDDHNGKKDITIKYKYQIGFSSGSDGSSEILKNTEIIKIKEEKITGGWTFGKKVTFAIANIIGEKI